MILKVSKKKSEVFFTSESLFAKAKGGELKIKELAKISI